MQEKKTKSSALAKVLVKTILGTLAAGSILFVVAVAPGILMLAGGKKQRLPWKEIEPRKVKQAVKRLAKQRDVKFQNHADGSVTVELTEKGRKRALRYKAEDLTISQPPRWDRIWRVLVFDIPERHKQARETFRFHLKKLGFSALQRSVFVLPYPCRDEIDFLSELYGVGEYVHLFHIPHTEETAWLNEYIPQSSVSK